MTERSSSKADRIIAAFKDHPIFAWVCVLGTVFLLVGQFAGAFKSIRELVSNTPQSMQASARNTEVAHKVEIPTQTEAVRSPLGDPPLPPNDLFGDDACSYVLIDRFLAETVDGFPEGFGLSFDGRDMQFSSGRLYGVLVLKNYDPVGARLGIVDYSQKLLPRVTYYPLPLGESRFFDVGAMNPTVAPVTKNSFMRTMDEYFPKLSGCSSFSPGPALIELEKSSQ